MSLGLEAPVSSQLSPQFEAKRVLVVRHGEGLHQLKGYTPKEGDLAGGNHLFVDNFNLKKGNSVSY